MLCRAIIFSIKIYQLSIYLQSIKIIMAYILLKNIIYYIKKTVLLKSRSLLLPYKAVRHDSEIVIH